MSGDNTTVLIVDSCDNIVEVSSHSETATIEQVIEVVEIVTAGPAGPPGPTGLTGPAGDPFARTVIPFINQTTVTTATAQDFVGQVFILSRSDIEDHVITVTESGVANSFTSVGLLKLDSNNQWSAASKRMAFKDDANRYVVFDDSVSAWVIGDVGDHSTGYVSSNPRLGAGDSGSVPSTFGGVTIDINYSSIDSHHFSLCEPEIKHYSNDNLITIGFAGHPQTGFILI